MATIGEVARIVTGQAGESGDLVNASWLVWRSVTEECKRKGVKPRGGYFRYEGAFRSHVTRLWPTMNREERTNLEKAIYRFLKQLGMAECTHRREPTVWRVAEAWSATNAVVIPITMGVRLTRSEKKLSPHEAGEDLPPGEVTSRQKETPIPMGNPNPAEALAPVVAQRQEEQRTRRALLAEFIQNEVSQPVVAEEIAHALGVNVSTARNDLAYLVEQKIVFARQETPEERAIRFGATAFARRSNLYWGKKTVPQRTQREVVEGYIVERADRDAGTSQHEINRRLWCQLKRKGTRGKFTANELADKAGLHREAVRNRVRDMLDAKLIKEVEREGQRRVLRVLNQDKVREFLGQPVAETKVTPAPAPASKAKATPPTPKPVPGTDLIARAGEILQENTRLRETVATLRARVAELEAQVEELTAPPAVDPEVAAALEAWTPSEH